MPDLVAGASPEPPSSPAPQVTPRDALFGSWLRETQRLQVEYFDTNPNALTGPELADYVTWNTTALVVELGEALQEFPGWKPWLAKRGELSEAERDRFVNELIDVAHFLANLFCAMDCDDEELTERYAAKQQVNRDRHEAREYAGRAEGFE